MGCCGSTTTGAGAAPLDTGKRVNYTKGMLLGVDDFVQEQAWHIARRHELAREVLGYGTVRGLKVAVDPGAPRVRVTPGMALMPSGTPVCVPSEQCCDINAWLQKNWEQLPAVVNGATQPAALTVYVVLSYDSCATDLLPVPGEPCRSEEDLTAASRIADCFKLELRLQPPDQIEENAIRDFADWLAQVPVDPTSPPLSESEFLTQLREAALAWLEPSSPHPADFMFGSPASTLGSTDELLRAALRLWATELRPVWRARYGCGPSPTAPGGVDDAVLLAALNLQVHKSDKTADAEVDIVEDARPVLLSLRMVQELISQNPAPEPAISVQSALAFGMAPAVGIDTAYARADHSHGTPTLPPLGGDVVGPIQANEVVALRGDPIANVAPANNEVLVFNGGQWAPQPWPVAGAAVVAERRFGQATVVGTATTFARADHSHGTPTLVGDAEAVDVGNPAVQQLRVTGLRGVPVDATPPLTVGQVLTVQAQGTGFVWRPTAAGAVPTAGAVTAQTQFGLPSANGANNTAFARADHTHGTPALAGDVAAALVGGVQEVRVVQLQGRPVLNTQPQAQQVLAFNGTAWAPANAAGGGTGPAPATTPPPGLAFGQAGVTGTGIAYALATHSHSLPALPALGGDLSGAIGAAQVESLQRVPLRAPQPARGDMLFFDGQAWVPRAAPVAAGIVLVAAGVLSVDFAIGSTSLSLSPTSASANGRLGAANQTQQVIEIVAESMAGAPALLEGLVVKLTPMWNERRPVMAFVDAVRVVSARSVSFAIVIFAQQGLLGTTQRVHYEVSNFNPNRPV
jgi:hypothetical protein